MKKILIIIICLLIGIASFWGYNYYKSKKADEFNKNTISNIKNKFNEIVEVTENTDLYELVNKKFIKMGKISKGNTLELQEEQYSEKTKYFKIKDSNYYLSYNDIKKVDSIPTVNNRYKIYLPFNENIKTKNVTTFTDESGISFTINKSFDFPIIIKEDNKYGIEYKKQLYYISATDVEKTYEQENNTEKIKDKIITLTYHFIYDPNAEQCNQAICHTLEQFESHLKYIKDNGYLTLKLDELEMYLDGKVNLPYKSVVLTIDDGTLIDDKALRLLEEYEQYATLFVITGWIENYERLQSPYLLLESHTNKMHNQYECKGMGLQGGGILCKDEEYVLNDLKTCQDKLGGSVYFSYPFFDVNDHAIELLKKAGYRMAFIGQSNTNGFSKPGTNKYKIPRKSIFNSTTLDDLATLLS